MEPVRAILFARVNGDRHDPEMASRIAVQVEACRDYAESHGYQVAEVLRASFGEERRAFSQIRRLARAGEYDVLIASGIDRLSRRLEMSLKILKELRKFGVEVEFAVCPVVYPRDVLDGLIEMMAESDALERRRGQRARWTRVRAARAGRA